MKRVLLILILLTVHLFSAQNNVLIIKNRDGKIKKGKRINHIKNIYYDDLIKEQNEILKALDKLQKKRRESGNYDKTPMLKNAKHHLGGKYVWGGTVPAGFDCSGYVQYLYKKEGVSLPRTALQQSKVGKDVTWEPLIKGDLLFFLTDRKRGIPVTHVGMYLGNDKFIHAASKRKGIIISPFTPKSKYGKLFVKATRIIK
jgi:cell wall-associated NlpC family hydrolase